MAIRLAFRFDDPSPVSKRHVELNVMEELRKRQLPITFAVIPYRIRSGTEFRFTEERASHLLDGISSGLVEVALHGCFHRNSDYSTEGNLSEFYGVPHDRQDWLIHHGKMELERVFGPVVSGFVPPWNSYDAQTMRAVSAHGMSYISASNREPPGKGLPILPGTTQLSNVKKSISEARRFSYLDPIIIVVLHHYNFDRDDDDPPAAVYSYNEFGGVLDWITKQHDIQVLRLRDLADSIVSETLRWPIHNRIRNMLPWRLRHWLPERCFVTRPYWTQMIYALKQFSLTNWLSS